MLRWSVKARKKFLKKYNNKLIKERERENLRISLKVKNIVILIPLNICFIQKRYIK